MAAAESHSGDDPRGRHAEDAVETYGEEMLGQDGFVKMSSGSIIREEKMKQYQDQYPGEDADEESRFMDRAVMFGGAAVLSFAAIALARRRLSKNDEEN